MNFFGVLKMSVNFFVFLRCLFFLLFSCVFCFMKEDQSLLQGDEGKDKDLVILCTINAMPRKLDA